MGVYRYKTKPRPYQVRALKKAVKANRLALWMPMRSGKSKVAVDYASVLHGKHGVKRVLVLTHTITTFGVWRNEFEKHCPLDYTLSIKQTPDDHGDLQVMIVNVQSVYDRERIGRSWAPAPRKDLYDWKPEVIIIDEATCIGDPSAVQTAHLYRLVQKLGIRFILELTGTPVHRKIWGAFGQFKILDDSIFGTSVVAYRLDYGVWGGYGNKTLLKHRNMKKWRRKVAPHIYQMYRVPSRPPIEQIIPVELSEKTLAAYDEMLREGYLEVNGDEVTAELPITKALKLAQLAAGHVRSDGGRWHLLGNELRDAFKDTVTDLYNSEVTRIVVFARHIPELRAAALACKAAGYKTLLLHGAVPQDQREQRIAAFHDPGPARAFVSQIATGSMGIDLSAADTTLYYTLTESLMHKDQADARMRLHGDKRPLTYYYFLPRHTVLEKMFYALKEKMNLADYVAKHPDIISHTEKE